MMCNFVVISQECSCRIVFVSHCKSYYYFKVICFLKTSSTLYLNDSLFTMSVSNCMDNRNETLSLHLLNGHILVYCRIVEFLVEHLHFYNPIALFS